MTGKTSLSLNRQVAAALDWWREAGVDADFSDEASGWLADVESEPEAAPATAVATHENGDAQSTPERPQIGGAKEGWPSDLAAFRQWWLTEPSLDDGGLAPRIASRGNSGAELMIIVAQPEEQDREQLLTGPQGKLLAGFLAAAGIAAENASFVAVLPRHTPLPDWRALAAGRMGELLAHHVALGAPKRILVLGRNILPLCGHDPAQGPAALRNFNHEGVRVPAMAEVGPERLLANAATRARLWQRWLDWTDG
ncbi:hypothetical protein [Tsuneonella mangrovi]|uniref:hypothetical protein n=1 Tax=Tsuneonella mangrovi TaxID=1982042 RepID=UPI000BA20700|nr:hypothetical protein [Tsuneonella mangrovi]